MRALMISVAALALVSTSAAAEPSAWLKCDGLAKPEGIGTTAAMIGATVLTAGFYALTVESVGTPEPGEEGVQACTEALASPGLQPFWIRRVAILRARALHYAEAGNLDAALADLEATRAAAEGHVGELAFTRSQGVSIQLFEAALLIRKGRGAEGEALAIKAADARPYSSRVQELAAALLEVDPAYGADEERIQTRAAMLEPPDIARRGSAREWADPAGSADDWTAYLGYVRAIPPLGEFHMETMGFSPGSAVLLPMALARTAVADARAGRTDQAQALLDEPGLSAAWAPETPSTNKRMAKLEEMATRRSTTALAEAAPYRDMAKAWLLEKASKAAEAKALVGSRLPAHPAAIELFARLGSKTPEEGASKAAHDLERARRDLLAIHQPKLDVVPFARALPALEVPPKRPYASQPPYGFRGGPGYLDRANKKGGWTVEYIGANGMPMGEEVMLLRAAEVARSKGARSFRIVEQRAFGVFVEGGDATGPHMLTDNMQHVQLAIDVVFDPPSGPDDPWRGLALDADKVWADLNPLYTGPSIAR